MRTSYFCRKAYQRRLWGMDCSFVLARKMLSLFRPSFQNSLWRNCFIISPTQEFVVKIRPTLAAALEVVSPSSINHLKEAVLFFLTHHYEYGYFDFDIRFDLIIIRLWRFPKHFSNIIANA